MNERTNEEGGRYFEKRRKNEPKLVNFYKLVKLSNQKKHRNSFFEIDLER